MLKEQDVGRASQNWYFLFPEKQAKNDTFAGSSDLFLIRQYIKL